MAAAGVLLTVGILMVGLGVVLIRNADALPGSFVSPAAIESDPDTAAERARRWTQFRGGVAIACGLLLLLVGLALL
jgi:uncharacterized membrane protein HdeD (DUF308 family)